MKTIDLNGNNGCTIEITQAFKSPDNKLRVTVTDKNGKSLLLKDGNFEEYELRCYDIKGLISILRKCDKASERLQNEHEI